LEEGGRRLIRGNIQAFASRDWKTHEINQDNDISAQDLNRAPPEYEFKTLPLHQPAREPAQVRVDGCPFSKGNQPSGSIKVFVWPAE
jgi:hypothetical protein